MCTWSPAKSRVNWLSGDGQPESQNHQNRANSVADGDSAAAERHATGAFSVNRLSWLGTSRFAQPHPQS